ncbi:MAG TPA: phospholipase D-like domain-containing protein [Actinomycetota bacterium]|nr:phospholipase D-like domain-containing protein [Actinomycetota bacterium]
MIETHTLTDGGQRAIEVAERLAAFLGAARRTLDIAIYDLALSDGPAAPVVEAVRSAVRRDVAVRLVYDQESGMPIPVPPPPRTDEALIGTLGATVRPIPGVPDLMHHKYVVRDGDVVWTGSTNWTDDSWTREENVIVVVPSPRVARAYLRDFEQLWSRGRVGASGRFWVRAGHVGGSRVRPWFAPGRGKALGRRIASVIAGARRRIRVCSPVLTERHIIRALSGVASRGAVDLAGVCDGTQMLEVLGQWRRDPHAEWKIPVVGSILAAAPFGAKRSVPYAPGAVHDYMHAKVTVVDDVVFAGSYNLSGAGQQNAENVLEIRDEGLADRLASFIDEVRAMYSTPLRWPD